VNTDYSVAAHWQGGFDEAGLQRWAEDARELEVAESEGMGGGETSLLGQILSALDALGVSHDTG